MALAEETFVETSAAHRGSADVAMFDQFEDAKIIPSGND